MDSNIRITYCVTAQLDEGAVRAAVAQLSTDERRQCERLVRERDRRDFAVAHALLRRSLSACGDRAPHEWTFTPGPRGKPQLPGVAGARDRLSFNLAHTDGLVACGVTRDADIGIDVEAIDRRVDVLQLAARFFSKAEVAELERCPEPLRHARFIEVWTLKEAYVKARGDGLAYPLDRFAFLFDGSSSLRFQTETATPHSAWSFALFAPADRYRMAVAVNSQAPRERKLIVLAEHASDTLSSDAHTPIRHLS